MMSVGFQKAPATPKNTKIFCDDEKIVLNVKVGAFFKRARLAKDIEDAQ